MTRRKLRENVFLILFQYDFFPLEEMDEQIKLYFGSEEKETLSEEEKLEITVRAKGAILQIPDIDKKIEEQAEGWTIARMGKVELTIIRLALFEMFYDEEVPNPVAINEAIELAKKFGGEEAPSFVNGILAKLA